MRKELELELRLMVQQAIKDMAPPAREPQQVVMAPPKPNTRILSSSEVNIVSIEPSPPKKQLVEEEMD